MLRVKLSIMKKEKRIVVLEAKKNKVRFQLKTGEISRLSNILDNAGQVFLGIMVVSPLISGANQNGVYLVALGITSSLFVWFISLKLNGKVSEL